MVTSRKPYVRIWSGVFIVSLVANGLMGAHLLLQSARTDSADNRSEEVGQNRQRSSGRTEGSPGHTSVHRKKQGLSWKDLSSGDFQTFAENLRAAGCPEELIADLLVPEINRTFSRAATASYLERVKDRLPWQPSPDWAHWLSETEFSEIEDEYDKVVTRIFGEQYAGERGWRKWPHWTHRFQVREEKLSFLDSEMRERVGAQESERYRLKRKLRHSKPRPTDEEIEEQFLQRRLAHIEDLKNEYPADQVEEYVLRSSPYASIPRSVPGLKLTVDEMRQITRHFEEGRKAGDPVFADTLGKLRKLLGETRFQTFEPAVRIELEEIARRQKY